jgi:hypothetical protein
MKTNFEFDKISIPEITTREGHNKTRGRFAVFGRKYPNIGIAIACKSIPNSSN